MFTRGGFSPTIEALSDSHRASSDGFRGGFDCWVHRTRFNAENGASVGATRFLAESSVRVEHIVRASTIFEVEFVVVEFVSVLVVDVVEIEGIGDEGFCYKSVYAPCEVLTISAQTDRGIAVAIGMGSEDLVRLIILHSSIVRYAVLGELVDDFPNNYHNLTLLTIIRLSPLDILIPHLNPFVKHYFSENKKELENKRTVYSFRGLLAHTPDRYAEKRKGGGDYAVPNSFCQVFVPTMPSAERPFFR